MNQENISVFFRKNKKIVNVFGLIALFGLCVSVMIVFLIVIPGFREGDSQVDKEPSSAESDSVRNDNRDNNNDDNRVTEDELIFNSDEDPFAGETYELDIDSITDYVSIMVESNPLYSSNELISIKLSGNVLVITVVYQSDYPMDSVKYESTDFAAYVYSSNFEGVDEVKITSNLFTLNTTKDTYRRCYKETLSNPEGMNTEKAIELLSK
ncbi:hypothetical protein JW710_02040 [Candidatus Dojkabacteria bacterium]|nr:hypothetical protein [Candidatus Dojkabacteria bacterium]